MDLMPSPPVKRVPVERPAPVEKGKPVGRRVVLGMLGLGALGVWGGSRLSDFEQNVIAPLQNRDPTGLTDLLPAGGGFRFYSITDSEPNENATTYKLEVSGLVDRPMTLTLADLLAMKQTTLIKDFQCVTGWRVPQVHWSGVLLADLLHEVGVKPTAKALTFDSFDGEYTDSLTLAQASRPDVLVATHMLGAPVTRAHGGPVRLYVAPMYGYKSVKWLGAIKLVPAVEPGFWEQNGYDVDAWVGRSNGRDDASTS
jgi:DMSO/TMAO reductase YedYZ molybdopterin-dependent catalytic subunit